jgi:GxxExxY protein
MERSPIPEETDVIARAVVDAVYCVHKELGPGLLESVYEVCLCHELSIRELKFAKQVSVPVNYRGVRLETGFRLDLIVAEAVVVELKAVDELLPLHEAQLLTYLKLTGKRLGFLVNFNTTLIKHGIKRIAL